MIHSFRTFDPLTERSSSNAADFSRYTGDWLQSRRTENRTRVTPQRRFAVAQELALDGGKGLHFAQRCRWQIELRNADNLFKALGRIAISLLQVHAVAPDVAEMAKRVALHSLGRKGNAGERSRPTRFGQGKC